MHFAERKEFNSKVKSFIQKIHTSNKINKIISLPFKYVWYKLNDIEINKDDDYIFIVMANALWIYDESIFNKLNKNKNVHMICVLLDSMNIKTPMKDIVYKKMNKIKWDYIFTYDYIDAKKYEYEYLDEMYYSNNIMMNNVSKVKKGKYDAYFLGRLKPGREKLIMDIYSKLKDNNIKCKFDIWLRDDDLKSIKNLELKEGINYFNKQKEYKETLEEIQKSNCIIEILQDGQQAQTLRYFEAVVFNKKLLTNNSNVVNLKFYNPKYMKVFKNIDEIDFNWIKEKNDCNYNYRNEFSPVNLIKKIENFYNLEEKFDDKSKCDSTSV